MIEWRPTVLITRPRAWADARSDIADVVHVPTGDRLRSGMIAGDSMGSVMDRPGAERLIVAFKEHMPDIFLYWVHFGEFGGRLLKQLRRISPHTVFVHGSGNHVLGPEKVCWFIHKYRNFMDVVLTSTTDQARIKLIERWVKRVGTLYTFGFDPEEFTGPVSVPSHDCFFGGGDSVSEKKPKGRFKYSRFRHDLMVELNKRYKLLVHGGGTWPFEFKPGIHGIDYFRAMQSAKIVIGTYHDDLERRYSKRTVYGGASGRLFMTRYIPRMELDFEQGDNMVWYNTVPEALSLVEYYLEHDEEREDIAARQRAHFVRNHSWGARLGDFKRLIPRILEVQTEKAWRRNRR